MKLDQSNTCPHCGSVELTPNKVYETMHNGARQLFQCQACTELFSETYGTPMAQLKTPLSKVAGVLRVRSEGLGVRATARVFGIHKNTVTEWESRFVEQKEPLMLYAVCHEFIHLTFEGDELYTVIRERGEASDSEGWTAVVMERASRFIVEQRCGPKEAPLFEAVMSTVAAYIEQSDEVTFFCDGERRYGNVLFDLCAQTLREGQRGRPPRVLPEGVKVRVKNKGAQKTQCGRKRPKYEAPQREHPQTKQELDSADLHANHVEAHNASVRRRNSAFRRRTNT